MEKAKSTKPFTGMSGTSDPTKAKWSNKYRKNEMSFAQGWQGSSASSGGAAEALDEAKKKKSSMATKGIAMYSDKGGPVAIGRFNNSVGNATGIGTSGSGGTSSGATSGDGGGCGESLIERSFTTERYLDNRQLEIIRNKIACICNLPAINIRLYNNGKFYIDSMNERETQTILYKLQANPLVLSVSSNEGKYDFSYFNKYMQPTRKKNIYGTVDLNSTELVETVVGDAIRGGLDRLAGSIQAHKDKNSIINKIFAALWLTKSDRKPIIFISDGHTMPNNDIEKYIKRFAGNGIQIFNERDAFSSHLSTENKQIKNLYAPKRDEAQAFKTTYQNSDKQLQSFVETIINNQSNDKKLLAAYKIYYWMAYNDASDIVLKDLIQIFKTLNLNIDAQVISKLNACINEENSNDKSYKPSDIDPDVLLAIKHNKRLAFIFGENTIENLSDDFKNQCYISDLSKITEDDFKNVKLNYRDQQKLNDIKSDEGVNDTSTTSENLAEEIQPTKKVYFDSNFINDDYYKNSSISFLKQLQMEDEYNDYINSSEYNDMGYINNTDTSNIYSVDPQIELVFDQLSSRLNWMIQDGICSLPEIDNNTILVACDPEPEIITEMNKIIHDICDKMPVDISEDGMETIIYFQSNKKINESLLTVMTYEDAYNEVLNAINNCQQRKNAQDIINYLKLKNKFEILDSALEGDLIYIIKDNLYDDEFDDYDSFDYTFEINEEPEVDSYLSMQVVDDDVEDFDDISPFDIEYEEEFEDDDTLFEATQSKKLTSDQQIKLKDAIAKGDSDGVAALANQYAAANDPIKSQKAKEAGINLMT